MQSPVSDIDAEAAIMLVLSTAFFAWLLWQGWKASVYLMRNPPAFARLMVNLLFVVCFGVALGVIYSLVDLFVDLDQWQRGLSKSGSKMVALAIFAVAVACRSLFLDHLEKWARERLRRKYGRAVPPLDEAR